MAHSQVLFSNLQNRNGLNSSFPMILPTTTEIKRISKTALSRYLVLLLISTALFFSSSAQTDSLVIENQSILRKIVFRRDSTGVYSTSFLTKQTGQNYINPGTEEFGL